MIRPIFDQPKNALTPYVIEPAAGADLPAHGLPTEDEAPNTKGGVDKRTCSNSTRASPRVKAGPSCCGSQQRGSHRPARELAARLRRSWNVEHDAAGAVGRRYRRQTRWARPASPTTSTRPRGHARARHDDPGSASRFEGVGWPAVKLWLIGRWRSASLDLCIPCIERPACSFCGGGGRAMPSRIPSLLAPSPHRLWQLPPAGPPALSSHRLGP